jgi:hypothetical protein
MMLRGMAWLEHRAHRWNVWRESQMLDILKSHGMPTNHEDPAAKHQIQERVEVVQDRLELIETILIDNVPVVILEYTAGPESEFRRIDL